MGKGRHLHAMLVWSLIVFEVYTIANLTMVFLCYPTWGRTVGHLDEVNLCKHQPPMSCEVSKPLEFFTFKRDDLILNDYTSRAVSRAVEAFEWGKMLGQLKMVMWTTSCVLKHGWEIPWKWGSVTQNLSTKGLFHCWREIPLGLRLQSERSESIVPRVSRCDSSRSWGVCCFSKKTPL